MTTFSFPEAFADGTPLDHRAVREALTRAVQVLPMVVPLGSFVAANPLHGREHLRFEDAAVELARRSGAHAFLAEEDYRSLRRAGRITDDQLRAALLRRWPGGAPAPSGPHDPDLELSLADLLAGDPVEIAPPVGRTLSELHDHLTGGDLADRVDAVVARWSAVFVDRGQADWTLPHRQRGIWAAFRRMAPGDPTLRRLAGRRAARAIAELSDDPVAAVAQLSARRGLDDPHDLEVWATAACDRLPGWGAAVGCLGSDGAPTSTEPTADLIGWLALRLAIEDAVLTRRGVEGPLHRTVGAAPAESSGTDDVERAVERLAVWQEALELGFRDGLVDAIRRATPGGRGGRGGRGPDGPVTQVVMCIDPRSEGVRRHLEAVGHHETFGFAGFFGLPVRVGLLDADPVASCPVILEPAATVCEVPDDVAVGHRHADRHEAVRAAAVARHGAKAGAAAPFAFAEAAGWVMGPLAALRTMAPGLARKVESSLRQGVEPDVTTHMDLEGSDMPQEMKVAVAHSALRTIGLVSGFAPVVVLCGHRSETTNNPFAAALDCGACAGKAGGPNARILAGILNDATVRSALADRGVEIPTTTVFVAAEHETTTDTISFLDPHLIPPGRTEAWSALDRLRADLSLVSTALRIERCGSLPGAPGVAGAADAVVRRRSVDWAEPLPEWGLVANAAVVVGPRSLTEGLDLARRCFLHSYDPDLDSDGSVLAGILTGPLVVGHMISTQYYFSTVDPLRFGAGTKPLHNVVGGIGVLEGPAGDLRCGLPLESVSFAGERRHEPLRLLAVVNAPRDKLDALIAATPAVRDLLDNGWVRLVAGSQDEGWAERLRDGTWQHCGPMGDPTEEVNSDARTRVPAGR